MEQEEEEEGCCERALFEFDFDAISMRFRCGFDAISMRFRCDFDAISDANPMSNLCDPPPPLPPSRSGPLLLLPCFVYILPSCCLPAPSPLCGVHYCPYQISTMLEAPWEGAWGCELGLGTR